MSSPPERRYRWQMLSLLPLGIGAWAPIYAGVRARVFSWIAWGIVCTVLTAAGWAVSASSSGSAGGGMLIIAGWVGGVAASFTIARSYERRMTSPVLLASERAQQALSDRQRALELAQANPALAREMGVGRPDRAGAADAGLVDINNAAVTALMELPGVDGELATRIVEARAEVNGFSSLEDLGAALDLTGDEVERLRGQVVFLPR